MPLASQVHRDAALENISVAYQTQGLVSDKLAPIVPVLKESDVYYIFSRDSLVVPETIRAPGTVSNRSSFSLSTLTYRLDQHSLSDLIPDRLRDNADKAVQLEISVVEDLTRKIALRKEIDLASLVASAAAWANVTSLTSTFAWSANTTLSNPLLFVDSAATTILQASGMAPNVVLLDDRTYRACRTHVSIVERTRYVSAESADEKMLAAMFGVSEVLLAQGVQNPGPEGLADGTTNAYIWTDMAFVAYVEKSPGFRKPTALYSFVHRDQGTTAKVKRWREEQSEGDMVEVSRMFDHVAPLSAAGYLIWNTIQ